MARIYLGDSVYAELELGMIRLSTDNGEGETNIIFLEREVMENLTAFAKIVAEGPVGEPDHG